MLDDCVESDSRGFEIAKVGFEDAASSRALLDLYSQTVLDGRERRDKILSLLYSRNQVVYQPRIFADLR